MAALRSPLYDISDFMRRFLIASCSEKTSPRPRSSSNRETRRLDSWRFHTRMRDIGRYLIIPSDAYPALQQAVVILSHSSKKAEAAAFLQYLKKPEATAVLRHYGFSVPKEAQEAKH